MTGILIELIVNVWNQPMSDAKKSNFKQSIQHRQSQALVDKPPTDHTGVGNPLDPVQIESQEPALNPELAMIHCPNCSRKLESHRCKLQCERCGYFMDCSDYY